jgi:predicted TPR repeat methyltransferase
MKGSYFPAPSNDRGMSNIGLMPDSSDSRFENAKAEFLLGLDCYQRGHYAEAEGHYLASLSLIPGRASTLVNLAATRLRLQHPEHALGSANEALDIEPESTDALLHRAVALQQLGRLDEALDAFDKLLIIDKTSAAAWSGSGTLLREMSRLKEAAHAFREALRHGADVDLHTFYLASVEGSGSGGEAPSSAPEAYVRTLFDDYADDFEQHVVGQLKYDAHRKLVDGLFELDSGPYRSALDLGCGTGLCGPLVRRHVEHLTGIDLSPRMLEKARALAVYDELVCIDVVDYLEKSNIELDLILAADVFIYVGELEPVFAEARRLMKRGMFCFSVELAEADASEDGAGVQLQPSLRYAHSKAYLQRLASKHRFRVVAMQQRVVREDQAQPVGGLFVYLAPL